MSKVLVETSARHLHLSPADLETLFGKGFELTFKKALSQPGQFATNEKVEVIGPKSRWVSSRFWALCVPRPRWNFP